MSPMTAEEFLASRTAGMKHSGRAFLEHLTGVRDLLQGDDVRNAGLFHSIYGTNAFRPQAVPLSERDEIAALIGPEAERLAYIFCCCKRPRALIEAAQRRPYRVTNWRTGETLMLSRKDIIDLLRIEIANLTEQRAERMLGQVIEALEHVEMTGHGKA
jgi:hypothetical protein